MKGSSAETGQGRSFDWETVRQRIAEISAAMEDSTEMSPEELQQIWARRAVELARVPDEEDEGEHIRLVILRLGREVYGIDAQYVYYVRPADSITYVPRVPEWVAGVVNLRGRILSVVDLRRFFGLPLAEISESDESERGEETPYLVVVETSDMEVALLVDDVLTVEPFPISQIQDATGTVRGLRPEYVQGVVACGVGEADPVKGSVLVVLDLIALLADERLIVHEEIV